MKNLDWVQIQADRHRRLLRLQQVISKEMSSDHLYAESVIRSTLRMIRRHHGAEAEKQTRDQFGLHEFAA
ncbi:hypothetical protein [Geoalkalibacter subterraneus]|uniref:Uncharacterized protein n=1 Tax=Geoalkalibacter subterraneus TaxID=483547 RepID=A0A0B5FXJ6_9BACT|nr:hypothetical protein [Geoalkalibacter subterraneus]AJF08311.1 hypothetical protein GSUB_17725 [Geoalkalibacter subterraneus]